MTKFTAFALFVTALAAAIGASASPSAIEFSSSYSHCLACEGGR